MIITEDTTWKYGDLVSLSEDVEIANGVNLEIEPGVVVNGNGFKLANFGGNIKIGSQASVLRVEINDVDFEGPGDYTIYNSDFDRGSLFNRQGGSGLSNFSNIFAEGNTFKEVQGFDLNAFQNLYWPSFGYTFYRNVFFECSEEFNVHLKSGNTKKSFASFDKNLFYGRGIESSESSEPNALQITNNSFYSMAPPYFYAIEINSNYQSNGLVFADENFIDGATEASLADFIFDDNDSLDAGGYVLPNTFVDAPNIDTPKLDMDLSNSVVYGGLDDHHMIWGSESLFTQIYDGGAGSNTLNFSQLAFKIFTIDLNAGSITSKSGFETGQFSNFQNIIGTDNTDIILGSLEDNTLIGKAGSDILEGRAGDDTLYGGDGSDIFRFTKYDGQVLGTDIIKDFSASEDVLEIVGFNESLVTKSLNSEGNDTFKFIEEGNDSILVIENTNSSDTLKFNRLKNISVELLGDNSSKKISVDSAGRAVSTQALFNSVKLDEITDFNTQISSATTEGSAISISDVVSQLRDIVGLDSLTGKAQAAADIDNDGEIQISDVVSNLRHIVGLDQIDTFDLVTENGFSINALAADSIGNLSIVINGDADQSHADWIALTDTSVSGTSSDDIIDLNSSDYKLARQTIAVDGGAGNDEITGSIADENIVGDAGNDKLLGGGGRNTLTGGAGADEFQFDKSSLNTFVTDFSLSEGDSLKFINHSDDSFSFDKNSIRPNSESDGVLIDYIADGSSGTFDLSLGLKDVSLHTNGALKADAGNGSWFDRSISVNGLELVVAGEVGGQAAVPNDWVYKVAQTVNLLIDPYADGIDLSAQNEMIKVLSGEAGTWHAGLPTAQRVANGEGNSYSPNPLYNPESYTGYEAWLDSHMQNDMVWYYDPEQISTSIDEQINEVLEHLMHTIHVFGVRGAVEGSYDALMGTDIEVETSQDYKNQELYLAMTEAKANGIFDPDYDHLPDNVLMKEYTYLLNYNMWELGKIFWEDDNGDGLGSLAPEWSNEARTPAGILQNNPLGYELFEKYFDPVLSKPDAQALRNLFDESTVGASNYPVGFSALPGTDEFLLSVQIETI